MSVASLENTSKLHMHVYVCNMNHWQLQNLHVCAWCQLGFCTLGPSFSLKVKLCSQLGTDHCCSPHLSELEDTSVPTWMGPGFLTRMRAQCLLWSSTSTQISREGELDFWMKLARVSNCV